jgi:glutamate synthase (NADPH/NADH) large chain
VVEGVGDHGCEYMTGGVVVVLGPDRPQLRRRHVGGIAYVSTRTATSNTRCNLAMVELEPIPSEDELLERIATKAATSKATAWWTFRAT